MFHNRVERVVIDDHNVPRLRLEFGISLKIILLYVCVNVLTPCCLMIFYNYFEGYHC